MKQMIFRRMLIGLSFVICSSCSSNRLRHASSFEKNVQQASDADINANGPKDENAVASSEPGQSVVKEILSANEDKKAFLVPAPSIMGPDALKQVYEPIFGDKPRSEVKNNAFFTQNPGQFFSPAERAALGDFNVSGPVAGTTSEQPVLLSALSDLQTSYLAALRRFASDACRKFVTSEMAATENRVLVHERPLQQALINKFLSRLLRLSNSDQILSGVPEYTTALAAALEEAAADKSTPSKVKTKTYEAWVEVCVALATDPRVFMR